MLKIIVVSLLFFLVSCGDSPFLSDDSPSQVRGTAQQVASNDITIGDYIIRPHFDGVPTLYEDSPFVFMLMDKNGKLQSSKTDFNIYLWMPDHGHGSSPVIVEELSKGIYSVKDVFFIMPGLWDIHFELGVKSVKWSVEL